MPLWNLEDVTLDGSGRPRLEGISVSIPASRVAILGASGSGKTSLLNLLVGYEAPTGGQVTREEGRKFEIRNSKLEQEDMPVAGSGFEFRASNFEFHSDPQPLPFFWSPSDYGLWPHLTVREHLVAVSPAGAPGRVEELLLGFGLEGVQAAYPASLSQGECSRLSVARALAAQPRCLVLDEPLEHVDAALRDQCWRVLREQVARHSASLVFSTHSAERVLSEADWCLCLDEGRLVWSGPVEELYSSPSNPEIAAFLGPCNWVGGAIRQASGVASAPRVSVGDFSEIADSTRPGEETSLSENAVTEQSPGTQESIRSANAGSAISEKSPTLQPPPRVNGQHASDASSGSLSPASDVTFGEDSNRGERAGVRGPNTSDNPLTLTLSPTSMSNQNSQPIVGERGPEELSSSASVPPCLRGESSDPLAERLGGLTPPRSPGLQPVRPERLLIIPEETGPFRVESERFSGSLAEVELTQLDTGTSQRFYHRPARAALISGQRVSLRILAIVFAVALCLWQTGCNRGSAAEMSVVSSTIIRIPVDGKRMPAPRALTISPAKELYVLDDSGRILVYDQANTLIRQWKMPESSVGKPEGIRILQDGRVVIADTHYHRVVFFDQQGTLLSMFGSEGENPGQFTYPVDIMQDPQGFIYVAEYGGKDRIQKFTPDGKFVLEFGGLGTDVGQFQRPSGMVWIDGRIYVADAINNRVQVFDDLGKSLGVLDWADQGGLYYPYDIALSPHGQLFFVEYGGCRVSVANPAGKLVARFGHEGRGHHELWTPWALAVSDDNRVFIADTGNRRIVQLTLPGGQL